MGILTFHDLRLVTDGEADAHTGIDMKVDDKLTNGVGKKLWIRAQIGGCRGQDEIRVYHPTT